MNQALSLEEFLTDESVLAYFKSRRVDDSHREALELVLANWTDGSPLDTPTFEVQNRKILNPLRFLDTWAVEHHSNSLRPTIRGYIIALVFGIEKAKLLAPLFEEIYVRFQEAYFAKPGSAQISERDVAELLAVPTWQALAISEMTSQTGVCHVGQSAIGATIYPGKAILQYDTFWAALKSVAEIRDLFSGGAADLFNTSPAPVINPAEYLLGSSIGICPAALEHFNRAIERVSDDPAAAITSSRAMIEAAIKWVCHEQGWTVEGNGTSKQIRECFTLMEKAATEKDSHKPGIQVIINGLISAVNGLDEARNAMGDSHGAAPDAPKPSRRISRLAVGFASHATAYFLNTYEAVFRP